MGRRSVVLLAVVLSVAITASSLLSIFGLPSPRREAAAQTVQVISGPWSLLDPSFSPDGMTIAYVSNRSGGAQVWTMNLDGSHQTRLTYTSGDKSLPRWSPNGMMLAFLSQEGPSKNLWVMKADGTDLREVTGSGIVGSLDWNPASTRIAYDLGVGGNWNVWAASLDGSLSQITSGRDDMYPSWSPDGNDLVYSSNRTGNFAVYLLNLASGRETNLISSNGNSIEPRLSPAGDKLLFLSDVSGRWSIWKENLDGSGLEDLLGSNAMFRVPSWVPEIDRNADASWSADGTSITFLSSSTAAGVDLFNLQLSSPIPVNELGAVTLGVVISRVTANVSNVVQAARYPDGNVFVVSTREGHQNSFWMLRFTPPVYRSPYGNTEPIPGMQGTS